MYERFEHDFVSTKTKLSAMSAPNHQRTVFVILRKSVLGVFVIMFADALGIAIISIVLSKNLLHYYTFLTLVQAALMFMVGGAIDLRESAFTRITNRFNKIENHLRYEKHKQIQAKAAPYIVTGAVLFILSFILAYPLN